MDLASTVATTLSLGAIGIACLALAEKFVPIFPSYVLLMFLGMMAADGFGLIVAIVATTIGSTIGSLCWYGLGRGLGQRRVTRLVARYGRYVLLPPSLYERLVDSYRRNQFGATLIGHMLPAIRLYLGLPAGVFRVELRSFAFATLLGSLVWNAPFLGLGFLLRDSAHNPFSLGLPVAGGLLIGEFAIVWAVRQIRKAQSARRQQIENCARQMRG